MKRSPMIERVEAAENDETIVKIAVEVGALTALLFSLFWLLHHGV